MRAVVTGTAGFIGSALARRLLADGWQVTGIDALTPYYDTKEKMANLASIADHPAYQHVEARIETAQLDELMTDVTTVFHQAGQPGVRDSWVDFDEYVACNILATKNLLEAVTRSGVSRIIYASSSSVYGEQVEFPTLERATTQPRSPYGVTKLAAEHLVRAYALQFQFEAVSLRYFTVYGPGQRPDMAIRRLVDCATLGTTFKLFGDGRQVRDFTYLNDVVDANLLAATMPLIDRAPIYNICGGGQTSVRDIISELEILSGRALAVETSSVQAGDVTRTGGDSSQAHRELSWTPKTPIREGIRLTYEWARSRPSASAATKVG